MWNLFESAVYRGVKNAQKSTFIHAENLVKLNINKQYKFHVANSFSVYQARWALYDEDYPEIFQSRYFDNYALPIRVSTAGRWIDGKKWFDVSYRTNIFKKKLRFPTLVKKLKTHYTGDVDGLRKTILHHQRKCKRLWKNSYWQGRIPSSLQLYNEKNTSFPINDYEVWKTHPFYDKFEEIRNDRVIELIITNRDLDALMQVALDLEMVDCICTNYMEYY